MIRLLLFLSALSLAGPALAHSDHSHQPPWQEATAWPDRIIATVTDAPSTSFSVTWRTNQSVGVAVAQIAPATADARFDLAATTLRGQTQRLDLDAIDGPRGAIPVLENQGLPPVHYHEITFTDLTPDTLYAYRVRGQQGAWSAWRQLRTAPESGPVNFLFFGDAQTGIRSHITRSFDTARRVAPEARFAIHGGDLVNTAMYDKEWAEWFAALGSTHKVIPAIPVAGNHDYVNYTKAYDGGSRQETKLFTAEKSVTPIWRHQFSLPLEPSLPEGLQETAYDVRYTDDVHIFVIDSSGIDFDGQMRWLEESLTASNARWRIVTMHHPLFSFIGGKEHPASRARREALLKVMKRTEIDLILTGHRHTYQRGAYGDDVARFAVGQEHDVKTVFVVTASSTKRGRSKVKGWDRYAEDQQGSFQLTRAGDNTPIFAVFDIDGETLRYRAFDAVGTLYDAFTLRKDSTRGQKRLLDGPEAQQPTRTYDNTGPYIGWNDLR